MACVTIATIANSKLTNSDLALVINGKAVEIVFIDKRFHKSVVAQVDLIQGVAFVAFSISRNQNMVFVFWQCVAQDITLVLIPCFFSKDFVRYFFGSPFVTSIRYKRFTRKWRP